MDPHTKMKTGENRKGKLEATFIFPNGGHGLLGIPVDCAFHAWNWRLGRLPHIAKPSA